MATRTVSNAGGNWNSTGTWVEGLVPTSADDVVFTATSGNVTVTPSSVCLSINFSNYVNTITFTSGLSVSGNINLGTGGYTQAGASAIVMAASGTLTSNGVIWSRGFNITAGITCTLADAANISGVVTLSGATVTMNGFSMTMTNNVILSGTITGTTTLILSGTSKTAQFGTSITNNLTITGSYTQIAALVYKTGTLTCTIGSLSGGSLSLIGSCTLNCSNATFTAIGIGTGFTGTVTLTSSLITTGNFNHITAGVTATFNGSILYVGGGMTLSSGRIITGTTNIILNGTGTVTVTGLIQNNLTINTAGTITIGASFNYNTGTLTYTAGTIVTTGSNLFIAASTTLNTNGMSWEDITISAAVTVTINSLLTATGTLTLPNANITLAGTSGFSVGNLTSSTIGASSKTYTFTAGNTYKVTSSFTTSTTAILNLIFVSSTPGSQYNFILNQGVTQDIGFLNCTDANSSAGQTVWDYKGTLSNTTNWSLLPTEPKTIMKVVLI